MTPDEMVFRIETLETQLAAVLRVLWSIHNEDKGIANKIEKELSQFREKKPVIVLPIEMTESMVK
jgi:hypothetical protein